MLWLLPLALADVPAAARWFGTDRLAVGVAADGSFVNGDAGVGLLWDPDGGSGPFPLGADWLTAGNQYEAWVLAFSADGAPTTWTNAAPYGSSDLRFEWEPVVDTGRVVSIHGTVDREEAAVEAWIVAAREGDALYAVLAVTAHTDLDEVALGRAADPDPDAETTGDYDTHNVAGVSNDGVGYAAGAGDFDGRALALAVSDGVGGLTAWTAAPDDVEAGLTGEADGDYQIAVATRLGAFAAGETRTVIFAYAAGTDRDAAVATATDAATRDDLDGDGVGEGDCAPYDDRVWPGAAELADGLDNNCDGEVDEGSPARDDDGDGVSEAEGDCDDTDAAVFPGASPVDGVTDADCDGAADAGWAPDVPADRAEEAEVVGTCAVGPRAGVVSLLLAGLISLRRRR